MKNNYNSRDKILAAVDCIIFGFNNESLKVLLVKRNFEPEKGKWSLIGGFLKKQETLDDAATRILNNLTGLNNIYMEQLYTFSAVERDPQDRTISTSYYAIINIDDQDDELMKRYNANWFSLDEVPPLIFDHDAMVDKAVKRLRRRTSISPIGFDLLPEKFTMRQLQKLYESILNKNIDKRNFVNKIKSMGILNKLNEKDMSSSTKGSYLYVFDKEKYDKKLSDEFYLKL